MPQHLRRLIGSFAVFLILFLVIQQVMIPKSFGKFGHFRGDAIPENIAKELHYAGASNCIKCHDTIHAEKDEGFHKQLKCEVCHGPGLKHALYASKFKDGNLPDSLKLHKPIERNECAICHQKNAGRTKVQFDTINNSMIVQIDAMKHKLINKKTNEEQKCIRCHNPHQP